MRELIVKLGADKKGAETFLKLLELGAQQIGRASCRERV